MFCYGSSISSSVHNHITHVMFSYVSSISSSVTELGIICKLWNFKVWGTINTIYIYIFMYIYSGPDTLAYGTADVTGAQMLLAWLLNKMTLIYYCHYILLNWVSCERFWFNGFLLFWTIRQMTFTLTFIVPAIYHIYYTSRALGHG